MTVDVNPSSIELLQHVTLRQRKTRRLGKWCACRTISVKNISINQKIFRVSSQKITRTLGINCNQEFVNHGPTKHKYIHVLAKWLLVIIDIRISSTVPLKEHDKILGLFFSSNFSFKDHPWIFNQFRIPLYWPNWGVKISGMSFSYNSSHKAFFQNFHLSL